MKRLLKSEIVLFLILTMLLIPIQIPVVAASTSDYPTSIAGYPVINVADSGNTPNLSDDKVIVTLFVGNIALKDNVMNETRDTIFEYLKQNPLPKGCSVEIYGGPGASKELYEKTRNENLELNKKLGPITLGQPSQIVENEASLLAMDHASFATCRNLDAGSGTVTYQSVNWYSPSSMGSYLNKFFALLNNGLTNTGYFVQCGQAYQANPGNPAVGRNIYSDTSFSCQAQDFNVSYATNHHMRFSLGYLGAGNGWGMVCVDYTAGLWDEYDEGSATGTSLASDWNTSVFLENYNQNSTPNWWQGFPQYINVDTAVEVYNNTWQNWTSEWKINQDAWAYVQTQNVITGSLTSGQTASWNLHNVLPGAYY